MLCGYCGGVRSCPVVRVFGSGPKPRVSVSSIAVTPRETIFHDDEDRARFLQRLAEYRDRFELRIYHYCLMGNHFHVLLQLPDPRGVSRVMAGLLVAYWHHYRLRLGLVGHLFQGRFKSPAVEADEYLLSCGRYIERNPHVV